MTEERIYADYLEDILRSYPHLTEDDIQAALMYASRFLKNEIVIELGSSR